jgi:transcriptional regulator with PAS, ATPase and Fis domain
MATYENAAIQDALAKSRGNSKKAAEILGIGEVTVYRKMRKYQIRV